jgi:phosphoesterase RecJ-like protein
MLNRIIELIEQYRTFLITSHIRPDGDALGSELALYAVLKGMGKEVGIYNRDETPDNYKFLPGSEVISQDLGDPGLYDVVFVLDCSDLERLGDQGAVLASLPRIINIDHHVSNQVFCEVTYIDREASSTGELLYRLFRKMGAPITPAVANNLYAALMTDTGGFRYRNTKRETLYAAGYLVEKGADPQWLAENIYENTPPAKVRLLSKVLETLNFSLEGRVADIHISLASLAETGARSEHAEGLVDIPRTIRGVVVSILYLELEPNYYKLSLRSQGTTNVEQVARHFGGGGHINAAACKIRGNLEVIRQQVVDRLRAAL